MTTQLTMAFLPLTDCAVLAAARELGFAEEENIALTLVRDTSWATVRDRLIYGQVDGAHMLAPLAVAVSLGLSQHRASLLSPFKLGLNGNLVVVSQRLAGLLDNKDAVARVDDPASAARDLAQAMRASSSPPRLGVVHRFSSHALMLRYWLASAGLEPDRDFTLHVLAPSMMVDALRSAEIDGFCAGEPWGSVAVAAGAEVVAAGARIWQRGVEKLLTFRTDWAEAHPDVVDALLRALGRAAAWCDAPANRERLAGILSSDAYVGVPEEALLPALSGRIALGQGAGHAVIEDFMLFHREAANFPWRSQGLWIYSQLVRWGFVAPSPEAQAASAAVFRSDIYRRALAGSATPMPGASAKVEGALSAPLAVGAVSGRLTLGPDRFFDGRVFDPDAIDEYLATFSCTRG